MVYVRGGGFSLRKGLTIGQGEEGERIQQCIRNFATEVADDAEAFLGVHQYQQIDDLILTGGGTIIPVVRNILFERLRPYGIRKAHMYVQKGIKTETYQQPFELSLTRGATALGAASVYFDFAE